MTGPFRTAHEIFSWYLAIVSGLVTLIAFNGTLFPFIKDLTQHFSKLNSTFTNSSKLEQHLIDIPPLIFQALESISPYVWPFIIHFLFVIIDLSIGLWKEKNKRNRIHKLAATNQQLQQPTIPTNEGETPL